MDEAKRPDSARVPVRSGRSVTRLLQLYPAPWRARYGEEFTALLEDYPASPLTVVDIVLGALDARLHPEAITGGMPMLPKLRTSALIVFATWVVYVLAGLGFNGMLDDNPLSGLASSRLELRLAVLIVMAGAALGFLGILAGGLPIGWTMLRQALANRRRDVLLLIAVPVLGLVIVAASVLAVFLIARGATGRVEVFGITVFWWIQIIFDVVALASTLALAQAALRSEISAQLYRAARTPARLVVLAMILTVAGLIFWGVAAYVDDPTAFRTAPGYLDIRTDISWLLIAAVMCACTAIGALGLRRGSEEPQAPA